jgi:hypothetical protein
VGHLTSLGKFPSVQRLRYRSDGKTSGRLRLDHEGTCTGPEDDTHAFIWFMEGSERLSQAARTEIEGTEGRLLLSAASAWEMAIKTSLGKLDRAKPLGELLPPLLADGGIELDRAFAKLEGTERV